MPPIKFASVLLFLTIFPANAAQATPDNPVVKGGVISNTHGSYPSPQVGDGDWTHVGVDIAANCGNDVYALADGKVVEIVKDRTDWRYAKGLGFAVLIKHPEEQNTWNQRPFYTLYLHLNEPPLKDVGDQVAGRQTVVGKVGNTGTKAEGTDENCHTHFEVRYFQGVEGFWHPQWGEQTESGMTLNIYGRGNQSESPMLSTEWKDPAVLFADHPKVITRSVAPVSSFIGTWQGTVVQQGYGSYPTVMTLTDTGKGTRGAVIGRIEYPTLSCGGSLTLIDIRTRSLILKETIEHGRSKCIDGGSIHLAFDDKGVLSWEWSYPDGRHGASATLVGQKSNRLGQTKIAKLGGGKVPSQGSELAEGTSTQSREGKAAGRIVNEAEGHWYTLARGCKAIFEPFPELSTLQWSGDCVDGKAHGKGRWSYMYQGRVRTGEGYYFNGLYVDLAACFDYWQKLNPTIKLLPNWDFLIYAGRHASSDTDFWLQVRTTYQSNWSPRCVPEWGDMYAVLGSEITIEAFSNNRFADELRKVAIQGVEQLQEKISAEYGKPGFDTMQIVPRTYQVMTGRNKKSTLRPLYFRFSGILAHLKGRAPLKIRNYAKQELDRRQTRKRLRSFQSLFAAVEKEQVRILSQIKRDQPIPVVKDLNEQSALLLIRHFEEYPKVFSEKYFHNTKHDSILGHEVQRLEAIGYIRCGKIQIISTTGFKVFGNGKYLVEDCGQTSVSREYRVSFYVVKKYVSKIMDIVSDSKTGTAVVTYGLRVSELPYLQYLRKIDPERVQRVLGHLNVAEFRETNKAVLRRWDQGWRVVQ